MYLITFYRLISSYASCKNHIRGGCGVNGTMVKEVTTSSHQFRKKWEPPIDATLAYFDSEKQCVCVRLNPSQECIT